MNTIELSNLLLIGGTGRNVGKTALACQLIEKFSKSELVCSIKISPHFHSLSTDCEIVEQNENYIITIEKDFLSNKDSARMLQAGAHKVFYIQTFDNFLQEAFLKVVSQIGKNNLIICESGGLINQIKPALFVACASPNKNEHKPVSTIFQNLCDLWLVFENNLVDENWERITIDNKKWIIEI